MLGRLRDVAVDLVGLSWFLPQLPLWHYWVSPVTSYMVSIDDIWKRGCVRGSQKLHKPDQAQTCRIHPGQQPPPQNRLPSRKQVRRDRLTQQPAR